MATNPLRYAISKLGTRARCVVLSIALCALAACEGMVVTGPGGPSDSGRRPPPPQPTGCAPGQYVGTLDAEGPNAYLNGRPARDGDQVCENDALATGSGSSIRVYLGDDAQSDYIQLNSNTDPRLRRARGSRCILIDNLRRGDLYLENLRRNTCFVFRHESIAFLQQSGQAHIRQTGARTELTVIRGSVSQLRIDPNVLDRVSRAEIERQVVAPMPANTRLIVVGPRQMQRIQIPPNEAEGTARWRFDFRRLQQAPLRRTVPPR